MWLLGVSRAPDVIRHQSHQGARGPRALAAVALDVSELSMQRHQRSFKSIKAFTRRYQSSRRLRSDGAATSDANGKQTHPMEKGQQMGACHDNFPQSWSSGSSGTKCSFGQGPGRAGTRGRHCLPCGDAIGRGSHCLHGCAFPRLKGHGRGRTRSYAAAAAKQLPFSARKCLPTPSEVSDRPHSRPAGLASTYRSSPSHVPCA